MKHNINERLDTLKHGGEISLAIEGRYTNLRIWTGKDAPGNHDFTDHSTIFMRLDKANNYSAPLSEDSATYLENITPEIKLLLQYGFKSDISNLSNILDITKNMKDRECIGW